MGVAISPLILCSAVTRPPSSGCPGSTDAGSCSKTIAPELSGGPPPSGLKLTNVQAASEGHYVDLPELPPSNGALMLGGPDALGPLAAVIPLDGLFEDRLDAARRLWRLLTTARTRDSPAASRSSDAAG